MRFVGLSSCQPPRPHDLGHHHFSGEYVLLYDGKAKRGRLQSFLKHNEQLL